MEQAFTVSSRMPRNTAGEKKKRQGERKGVVDIGEVGFIWRIYLDGYLEDLFGGMIDMDYHTTKH